MKLSMLSNLESQKKKKEGAVLLIEKWTEERDRVTQVNRLFEGTFFFFKRCIENTPACSFPCYLGMC